MSISSSQSYTPIPSRKPWTTKEDELLTELRKNNNLDWIEVARRIDGRNPSYSAFIEDFPQGIYKMKNFNTYRLNQYIILQLFYTDLQNNYINLQKSDIVGVWVNQNPGEFTMNILYKNLIFIFNLLFTELQCAQRWKRIKGYKLRKQWTEEENQKLIDLVAKFGYHWSKISSLLPQRTGKQIREHYLNQLHPDINNEPWTKEEDEIVVEFYKKLGGKWSQISKNLNNRSENSIKNRFYSYLRNKYLNIKNPYYIVLQKIIYIYQNSKIIKDQFTQIKNYINFNKIIPEKKQKLNECNYSEQKQEKQITNPIKQDSSFQTNYQQVPKDQNTQLFMPIYQNQFIQYPMAYPCAMFVPIYLYQQQGPQLNQVIRY